MYLAELADKRFTAIMLANSAIYASPSYDEKGVRSKQQMWNTFINSLDPKKFDSKKKKPEHNSLLRFFKAMGVQIQGKKE